MVFLGEDEINAGLISCKDMASGEQTKLDYGQTLSRIQAGLAQKRSGTVIRETK